MKTNNITTENREQLTNNEMKRDLKSGFIDDCTLKAKGFEGGSFVISAIDDGIDELIEVYQYHSKLEYETDLKLLK